MKVDLDNLTTQQAASLLSISVRQLGNLVNAGVIPKHGQFKTARYKASECVEGYLAHRLAALKPSKAGEDAESIEQAELRVKNADAELKELKAAQLKGDLIEVEYVERSLAQMFGNLRSRVLGMPAKLTPQLVSVPSPVKVKAILEKETRAACEELVKIASKTPKVEVEDD